MIHCIILGCFGATKSDGTSGICGYVKLIDAVMPFQHSFGASAWVIWVVSASLSYIIYSFIFLMRLDRIIDHITHIKAESAGHRVRF